MELKFVKVYLSGGKRIQELYEEGCRKDAKIAELEKAIRFKQVQHKGYGKELAQLLQQIEERKICCTVMSKDRDAWKAMYMESEKARKSLAEKLEKAMGAIELLRGGPSMTDPSTPLRYAQDDTPSVQCAHWAHPSPPEGEARAEGGARA